MPALRLPGDIYGTEYIEVTDYLSSTPSLREEIRMERKGQREKTESSGGREMEKAEEW